MSKPDVVIVLKEGKVIEARCAPRSLELRVLTIVIHNYDVKGMDPKLLKQDEEGNLYQVQLTGSSRKGLSNNGGLKHD